MLILLLLPINRGYEFFKEIIKRKEENTEDESQSFEIICAMGYR